MLCLSLQLQSTKAYTIAFAGLLTYRRLAPSHVMYHSGFCQTFVFTAYSSGTVQDSHLIPSHNKVVLQTRCKVTKKKRDNKIFCIFAKKLAL